MQVYFDVEVTEPIGVEIENDAVQLLPTWAEVQETLLEIALNEQEAVGQLGEVHAP